MTSPGNPPETSRAAARRGPHATHLTRITAAMVALVTVVMLGIGISMGAGQARTAVTIPTIDNPAGQLGQILDILVNNPTTEGFAKSLRMELCASGGSSGGADCSLSNGSGLAIVMPDRIELIPRVDDSSGTDVLYNGIAQYLNNAPREPQRSDYPAGAQGGLQYTNAYTAYLFELAAYRTAVGVAHDVIGVTMPIPGAPVTSGSARVIGDGFQFAMASGGGNATAISFLPVSLATAGASGGRTAFAFALVGTANAWTTDAIPVTLLGSNTLHPLGGLFPVTLPSIPAVKSVGCYGGLAVAYAQDVGACANVLGIFDVKFDQLQRIPQVQFGLTDPSAVLVDPNGVLDKVLRDVFAGRTPTLSKDVVRLSLGGDSLIALTSEYGLSAPVTLDWLGSTVTFFPTTGINGVQRPNRLALPQIAFGTLDSGKIVPVLTVPRSTFPFGLAPVGPFTTAGVGLPSATSAKTLAAAPTTRTGSTASRVTTAASGDDSEGDDSRGITTETSATAAAPATTRPSTTRPSTTGTSTTGTSTTGPSTTGPSTTTGSAPTSSDAEDGDTDTDTDGHGTPTAADAR